MKRLRSRQQALAREMLLALAGPLALASLPACREPAREGPERRAPASDSAPGVRPSAPAVRATPAPCSAPPSLAADADALAWFPTSTRRHCIDPHSDVRRYGGKGEPPLSAACASLGVACDLPIRLGLARVVSVRYVDAAGGSGRLRASAWSFADPELALAYLTERAATDLELGRRPSPIGAGAGGVLTGSGAAIVRGAVVVLLEVEDDRATPAERANRAAEVLPELAKAVGERLPGPAALPPAVGLLPPEGRSLLALRYEGFDLFGIAGMGRGARAHYEGPDGIVDLVALVRGDEDAADDVMLTLRKVDGARKIKQAPYGAIRWRQTEGTKLPMDWVFGRRGTVVLGVGAPVVVTPKKKGMPKPPDRSLLRLKALLDRTAGR